MDSKVLYARLLVALAVMGLARGGSARADLVGYWPLDGNATATVGTSGFEMNGPAPTVDRNGTYGGALAFDGTLEQYVEIAGGGGLDGLYVGTISLWVKWSGFQSGGVHGGNYGTILARQENSIFSNNMISLAGEDPAAAGVQWTSSGAGAPTVVGGAVVGDETWHHVAVTFQPSFTGVNELFLDGVSQGTAAGECLSLSPTTSLSLGAWLGDGKCYSIASMDDVAVFDDILGPGQIASLASQTKTPLDVGAGTRPDELPIRGVVATASTELTTGTFSRLAANATDGVGRATTTPDGVAGRIQGMWLNNGTFAAPNDLAPEITFDLGEAQPVAKLVVYNYNENYAAGPNLTSRGVNEVEVFTSLDGMTFVSQGTHQLDQAPGDATNPGQVVSLGGVTARYVKLDIVSNHGDANLFAGLNEVDFYLGEPSEFHPGDANGDGQVNDLDASILAANWQKASGATWGEADFNGDGMVTDLDASILAANWQYGVGSSAVPEPSTLVLLGGLAALGWWRTRRGQR